MGEEDDNLVFDSKFEGGNLLSAYRVMKAEQTYTLFMQNDTNTYGYCLLYTSPSPRDQRGSRMPSSA